MKKLTIVLSLLTSQLLAQNTKPKNVYDTSSHTIALHKITNDKKILVVDCGKHALVYFGFDQFVGKVSNKNAVHEVDTKLDSLAKLTDTIRVDMRDTTLFTKNELINIRVRIDHKLEKGEAQVYDKKNKTFVNSITCGLEKYGTTATMFYYLPEERAFFSFRKIPE